MNNILIRLLGWQATVLQREPAVYDRWRWLKRHLHPGPLRTLDAGCGAGEFTLYAARIGNSAIGLSYDKSLNRIGQSRAALLHLGNVEFRAMDLRELDLHMPQLGQFDQIICLETIEHILNDRKLVHDLAGLLKPGGRLLLTTPYSHAWRHSRERLSEREDCGHVRWGYTHAEMRTLLEAHGISVVAEEFIGGCVSQMLTMWMETDRRWWRYIIWTITFPLRALTVLDTALARWFRYPWTTIGVVGLKSESA